MRSSPHAGCHFTCLDRLQRAPAQIVAVHADEPLLGRAEDRRVVAAPAVRIAVRDLLLARQRAVLLQNPITSGFASHTVLPINSSGSRPAAPSAWKNRPAPSTGQNTGRPYLIARVVVFLPVPRRRVHRARALFERHVIGQHAQRIALQKRMPEHRAFELRPRERRDHFRLRPAALLRRRLQQFQRDDDRPRRRLPPPRIRTSGDRRCRRWPESSTASSSRSARRPSCPPAPDRSPPDRMSARTAPRSTGWCGLSYSTSASASAVRSWMHQFTGFRPL